MANDSSRCANCGTLLPTPDAVCPRCESELSSAVGKYRCPNCDSHFDQPAQGWWPLNAPWYWPQKQKAQCPHCKVCLRDKKALVITPIEWWGAFAILIVVNFSPWRPGTQIVALVLLGLLSLLYFVRWKRAKASVHSEEERFAVETGGS